MTTLHFTPGYIYPGAAGDVQGHSVNNADTSVFTVLSFLYLYKVTIIYVFSFIYLKKQEWYYVIVSIII